MAATEKKLPEGADWNSFEGAQAEKEILHPHTGQVYVNRGAIVLENQSAQLVWWVIHGLYTWAQLEDMLMLPPPE